MRTCPARHRDQHVPTVPAAAASPDDRAGQLRAFRERRIHPVREHRQALQRLARDDRHGEQRHERQHRPDRDALERCHPVPVRRRDRSPHPWSHMPRPSPTASSESIMVTTVSRNVTAMSSCAASIDAMVVASWSIQTMCGASHAAAIGMREPGCVVHDATRQHPRPVERRQPAVERVPPVDVELVHPPRRQGQQSRACLLQEREVLAPRPREQQVVDPQRRPCLERRRPGCLGGRLGVVRPRRERLEEPSFARSVSSVASATASSAAARRGGARR